MLAHTAFLRASSEASGLDLDITTVASGHAPAIDHGAELVAIADALTGDWQSDPAEPRTALVEAAGAEAAERAIGVVATFQMMNRLLDGVGAPVNPALHGLATELGFAVEDLPR